MKKYISVVSSFLTQDIYQPKILEMLSRLIEKVGSIIFLYLDSRKVSVIQKMRIVIKERGGFFGLYRGIMPGTIRSFLANGTSMVVMQFAQRKVTELGLRD